jgi:hypothetical protein
VQFHWQYYKYSWNYNYVKVTIWYWDELRQIGIWTRRSHQLRCIRSRRKLIVILECVVYIWWRTRGTALLILWGLTLKQGLHGWRALLRSVAPATMAEMYL